MKSASPSHIGFATGQFKACIAGAGGITKGIFVAVSATEDATHNAGPTILPCDGSKANSTGAPLGIALNTAAAGGVVIVQTRGEVDFTAGGALAAPLVITSDAVGVPVTATGTGKAGFAIVTKSTNASLVGRCYLGATPVIT